MIGKAPPFRLWLASGDIDFPKSACLGGEACEVSDELAGVLVDFAERAGNYRKDVASVELAEGLLKWSHLAV